MGIAANKGACLDQIELGAALKGAGSLHFA
jgi:hypothetical protein